MTEPFLQLLTHFNASSIWEPISAYILFNELNCCNISEWGLISAVEIGLGCV